MFCMILTFPACTTSRRPCLVIFSRAAIAFRSSYFSYGRCLVSGLLDSYEGGVCCHGAVLVGCAMVGSLGSVLGAFGCTVGSLVLFWAMFWLLYLVAVGEVLGATVGSLGDMKGLGVGLRTFKNLMENER